MWLNLQKKKKNDIIIDNENVKSLKVPTLNCTEKK